MRTTAARIAFGIVVGVAPSAFADGKDITFSAPTDKVYASALEVVATDFQLIQAQKDSLTITFRGQASGLMGSASASLLIADSSGKSKVIISTNGSKAGDRVRQKAFRLIGRKLADQHLIPIEELPKE